MKKSIYVSIPTLKDSEIENTINSAFKNASGKYSIHIGIACMTDKNFFEDLNHKFNNKNISIKHFDPESNVGVGIGRKNAASLYDDQDYFLQVDSHTKFEKNWDSYILKKYYGAVSATQNQKTVLTCYLPPYILDPKDGRVTLHQTPFYSFCLYGDFSSNKKIKIPNYKSLPLNQISQYSSLAAKFIPCTKFSANLGFGDKNFAENTGLQENSIFWEEELIQSFNLFKNGFNLVFPNVDDFPISHLYHGGSDSKTPTREDPLGSKDVEYENKINKNYSNYINDPSNKEALEEWSKYSLVHPKVGAAKHMYIPSKFHKYGDIKTLE